LRWRRASIERSGPDGASCPPGPADRRWTFYEIAPALNARHGDAWKVTPNEEFVYDQRMIDPRLDVPALNERLPELNDETD
jgi:hypothetical protein